MAITYEQARKDHEYLWGIGEAYDMTGGYVDSDDLAKLLRKPSKVTARECYCRQIDYWFEVGPDSREANREIPWDDPKVQGIAERHGHRP